ncbi:MAG: hypothetical protein M0002_08190 [Rhodospirillales bacterium]|nr:hypothetical protein [Rhodospirillales bacterium]
MALTAGFNIARRGPGGRNDFGYPVAPGEQIWRGGIVCVNASGQLQRIQTSGSVAAAGVAAQDFSNVGNAAASVTQVVGMRGTYALTVPAATASNIGANVYATDDATLTLTVPATGFTGAIGTLVGIDGGQTYVQMVGS